jgi:hypothetical protein
MNIKIGRAEGPGEGEAYMRDFSIFLANELEAVKPICVALLTRRSRKSDEGMTICAIGSSYHIFEENRGHGVVLKFVADELIQDTSIDVKLLVHWSCETFAFATPKMPE